MNKLILSIQPIALGIYRLEPSSKIPSWATNFEFFSVTKTKEKLSVVYDEQNIPTEIKAEKRWRAFKIDGPIDFSTVGILSSILSPLAKAGISIFAVSTFDTDYILVKQNNLENAVSVLKQTGIVIL